MPAPIIQTIDAMIPILSIRLIVFCFSLSVSSDRAVSDPDHSAQIFPSLASVFLCYFRL